MLFRHIISHIIISMLLLCPHSMANGTTNKHPLFNLSIQELLEVKVTSTSKQAQPIQKAPGVVRVFTRRDIENFGYLTLRDILANIPGVQLEESRNGHTLIYMRGVQSRYNSKILLM